MQSFRTSLRWTLGILLAATVFVTTGCEDDEVIPNETVIQNPGTVTDIDGNEYTTVVIGDRVWMAENLKTTRYRDGSSIFHAPEWDVWLDVDFGAYCQYDNDTLHAETYGRLYNWHAVNDARNLAPEGWHVATEADWDALIAHLGGDGVAGEVMNTGDFAALMGGTRGGTTINAVFMNQGDNAHWWSASKDGDGNAIGYGIGMSNPYTSKSASPAFHGRSVRCVMDLPTRD